MTARVGSNLHCLAAQNNGQRPEKTDLLSGVWDDRGLEYLMKEVCNLTAVVKEMEEKFNTKIDSLENDDRERVGNTVTQKDQNCETGTEQRRLRGGKVTGMKEQRNETNR